MKSRIPSPARSLGAPATPRRQPPRSSRSEGSPARSNISRRPSRLTEAMSDLKEGQSSFALTPLNRKSMLTDNTDIEEPRRKSWWKKLDDTSLEVVEVLHTDYGNNVEDIVEEFVDIEVPSLVSKNMTLDLPESSGNESIGSIVMPQRRLFTQKENVPRNKFDAVVGPRESLAEPQKTTEVDKTAKVGPKNQLGQGPSQRSRPVFPAGLVSTTPNKTAYNDESMEVAPKKLFGQQDAANKKKLFTKTLLETSPRKCENKEQEIAGPKTLLNKGEQPRQKPVFPAELFNVSSNSTRLASEIQGRAPNLFGNRAGVKRKNMFADIIVSESEEEIQDLQPKVFGFSKRTGSKEPQSGRGSSVSRGVRDSPMSITTDLELDDWKMLPSSTMMVDQLEDMVAGTPMKKIRLSKLSEQKESDGSKACTTVNKTKMSNKSTSSKNKSKSVQNNSKSNVVEDEIVIDEIELTDKQNKSKTEVKNENVNIDTDKSNTHTDEVVIENNAIHNIKNRTHSIHKNASKLSQTNTNIEIDQQNEGEKEMALVNNATYNIKNRTHSIHKNASTLSKTSINIEIDHQVLALPEPTQENEPEIPEQAKCLEEANIKGVDNKDNDDEEMALTYEEDVEELIVQEKQVENNQERQIIDNIADELKINASANKLNQTKVEVTEEIYKNQVEKSENKTEVMETEQITQIKEKYTPKDATAADDYADDNFEDVEMNLESVLEDEVSEIAQDDSKVETSNDCKDAEVEESIEQIQKEIEEGGRKDEHEKNPEQVGLHEKTAEDSHKNVATELSLEEIDHDEEKEKQQDVEQNQEIEQDDKSEEAGQREVEVEHTAEEIEQNDEEEGELSKAEAEVEAEESQEEIEEDEEVEVEPSEAEVEESQEEIVQDDEEEVEPSEAEVEESQEEIVQDDEEEAEQSDAEVEESQEEIEKEDEVEAEPSEAEVEESQEEIEQVDEEDAEPIEAEVEESQEEMEQDEDVESEQSEAEVEQSQEEIEQEDVEAEQSQEVDDQDDEEEEDQEIEQDQDTDSNIGQDSHDNMPSDQIPTPEQTDEIQESPNISHDTTGRNRKMIFNATQLKSPEAILKGTSPRNTTFEHQGRNTSVRKTKSMIRPLEHNPIAASIRDSICTNGSKSSAEGSGWDSHRTTRKTLRQTFGKDFTPRKSLRALVMEKSAQRKTLANVDVDITKAPQANSTEINVNEELSMPSMVDNVEDLAEDTVSDHEVSRKTRQTTLEMYLQKVKKDTLERKMRMENAVRESLKVPPNNIIQQFNLPSKLGSGGRKVSKPTASSKKAKTSTMPLGEIPKQLLEDMKYKPPKRFMPTNASWTTKRLYKFLESKLEPRYDYKARVRAEKLVATLYSFGKMIERLDAAPRDEIDQLKVELARLNVARTHFDFYNFFHEYMPREMRIKVVPDIQNKLPMPKYGLYSEIIRDINSRG